MARERAAILRQASPVALFVVCATVVMACEAMVHWLWPLMSSGSRPSEWATMLLEASLVAAIGTLAVWRYGRAPLLERDDDLCALMQASTDPLAIVDRFAVVREANAAAAEVFDGNGAPLVGRSLFEGVEDAQHGAEIKEACRSGRAVRFDKVLDARALRFNALPVFDEDGQVTRLAVHCQEVTEATLLRAADAMMADFDRRLIGADDIVTVLRHLCAELVQMFGLRLAWIGRKEDTGSIALITCAGADMDCDSEIRRNGPRWDDTAPGRGPVGLALRGGSVQLHKISDSSVQDWQKSARRFGIKAVLAVPFRVQGDMQGVLVLCARRDSRFDEPTVVAIAQSVAVRIGSALGGVADRQQLRLFTTGLEAAANGIFITDRSGTIEWANHAFCRMCGWTRSEVIGRNPRFLRSGQQDMAFYQAMWHAILAGEPWNATTVERRKDNSLYIVEQSITPIRDFRGEISHFIAVHEDVTRQRETEERLHHMAQYDGLTDLPNRALFFDRLGLGLAVARRNHHSLGLLYIDIDHFKTINDGYGHRLGDSVLQQVASRLRQVTRDSDTVARIASDEFCVILPQVLVRDDAMRVVDKVRNAMKAPLEADGEELRIGLSIGIALYPQDGETPETLIQRADAAMSVVKLQGRNNFKFAS